jgi:hypothetical protein
MNNQLITVVAWILGLVLIGWYIGVLFYAYIYLGTCKGPFEKNLAHQMSVNIGVSVIGALVLAIGFILISFQWADIWKKTIVGIVFASLAILLSTCAMSVTGITH